MDVPEVYKSLAPLGFSRYEASTFGKIRNIERNNTIVNGTLKNGIPYAFLTPDDTNKAKSVQLNRLIATLFVPNPENKRFVKHHDNNPQNLRADNLYWVTASENSKIGKQNQGARVRRAIYQLDENKKIVKKWDCINDAAEDLGCGVESLRGAINNNRYYKGSYWSYCDIYEGDNPNIKYKLVEMVGYKPVKVFYDGVIKSESGRIRVPTLNHSGYYEISLTPATEDSMPISYLVHRLLAIAFVDKPEKYKDIPFYELQVNHLDGNKINNAIDNLEWLTAAENVQHAIDTGLRSMERPHQAVVRVNKYGDIMKRYDGAEEAAKDIGCNVFSIYEVCRGEKNSVYGHIFCYD